MKSYVRTKANVLVLLLLMKGMRGMNVQEKINHLISIKEDLPGDQFKLTAARIFTKYVVGLMKENGKKLHRTDLLMKINVMLRGIGSSEVSYGFIRSFV